MSRTVSNNVASGGGIMDSLLAQALEIYFVLKKELPVRTPKQE